MTHSPARALLVATLIAAAAPALAAQHASIQVEDAWCPPTPPGAPTAAGYLTIRNLGHGPDRLTGSATPAATRVQLHGMTVTHGVMRMRELGDGLPIAGGATAQVQPGSGLHLMLIGLKRPLRTGERVPITLEFAHAGKVRADFVVRAQSAGPPAPHDRMAHMGGR